MLTWLGRLVSPPELGPVFRWSISASWANQLGDGIVRAAGPLLVAALTDDARLIALAATVQWLAPMLFALVAGVVSDRVDRKRIIVVGNMIRVAVIAALVALLATGTATIAVVLAALFLLGTTEVFVDSATGTVVPMIVPRPHLAIANQRQMVGFVTLNNLAGPPLGAFLFAVGMFWPLASQLVLVMAAVLLISRVQLPAITHDGPARRPREDLVEGVKWVWQSPAVRTLVLTIFVFNLTFGAAWSVLVLYASRQLGLGEVGFGLITTMGGIGGLIGGAIYGWLARRITLANLMRIGLIIETFTHLALAVTHTPWVAFGVFVVFGIHEFVWGTTSATIRQRAVPVRLQGRVNSVNTMATFGGLVIGSVLGGVLAESFGVSAPFFYAFAGSSLFVLLIWRSLRHIARADADDAASPE